MTILRNTSLALVALLLASCATPTASTRVGRVAPPGETGTIKPVASAVSDSSEAVEQSNRQLQRQVVSLRSATKEASTAASRAQSEVSRLAIQKTASEEDLLNLQVIMRDVAARNMFLEEAGRELEAKIVEQEEQIIRLMSDAAKSVVAASQKDYEVAELRNALADANERIVELDDAVEHYSKSAQREAESAAGAKTYRNILIAAGIVGVLWLLAPVVIRSLKPI